jgi:hypothetical protein
MSQTSFDTRGSNALSTVRVGPLQPAPDAAIFERLPIAPAAPFRTPRLRLVVEEHEEGGRRDAALAGRGVRVGRVQPRRTPLRLTRRGRLVMVISFALMATAVLFALGLVGSQASAAASGGTSNRGQGVPAASVVVQPGDTLWSIATRVAPRTDPRVTVQRIIDRNGLPDAAVEAGQVLVLPS